MLPFFIFVFMLCCHFLFLFFYEIYKEFLVYLIARLNLAINEQSEKFCMGLLIKQVWVSMGKNWGVWRTWEG